MASSQQFTKKDLQQLMSLLQQLFSQQVQQPPQPTPTPAPAPQPQPQPEPEPQPEPLPPPVIEQPPKPESETPESILHKLVNEARTKAGVGGLYYDNTLAEVAERHSIDMQQRNFFSHVNPNGLDPDDRARKLGFTGWKRFGENILWFSRSNLRVWTKQQIAQQCFNQWWNSPGHKKNMLSPYYNREGLGIWIYGNRCWATEDLAQK